MIKFTAHPPLSCSLKIVLRLGFAVIGVLDLPHAVAFWTAAPGLVASDEWHSDGWRTLYYADGSGRAPRHWRRQVGGDAGAGGYWQLWWGRRGECS